MNERQKRIELEEEVEAYKEELRESYSIMVELRYKVMLNSTCYEIVWCYSVFTEN